LLVIKYSLKYSNKEYCDGNDDTNKKQQKYHLDKLYKIGSNGSKKMEVIKNKK